MSRLLWILAALSFIIGCTKEETNTRNHLPRAAFSVIPPRAEPGDTIYFDAGIVTDVEDQLDSLQVQWMWSQGTTYTPYSHEKTAFHTYSAKGVYFPQVRVKDTQSLTDTTKKMVVIVDDLSNQPPAIPGLLWPPEWQTWVDPTIIFKWEAGPDPENDPLLFDLWVGRSINDLKLIKADIDTYNLVEGNRIYETTETGFLLDQDYYWQVAAKDPNGNYVPGWIWKFTTRPN